jgi:hypothetical protein
MPASMPLILMDSGMRRNDETSVDLRTLDITGFPLRTLRLCGDEFVWILRLNDVA